jgi:hypothetical protein
VRLRRPHPLFFSAESVKSGGFLDRFGRHLNRVPNAGATGKADRARPKGPRRVQPITFAFCSPHEPVRCSLQLTAKVFRLDRSDGAARGTPGNGRSSYELVALAFSHRHDRLPGLGAGGRSVRIQSPRPLFKLPGLHRGSTPPRFWTVFRPLVSAPPPFIITGLL